MIRDYINDIGIRRKLWLLNFLGVLVPMVVLFAIFSSNIMREYEQRERILIEEGFQRVHNNVRRLFESMDSLTYSYFVDNNINRTLEAYDGDTAYDVLNVFQDIESKIAADVYAYDYADDIVIFHKNPNFPFPGRIRYLEDEAEPDWYDLFYEGENQQLIRTEWLNNELKIYYIRKLNHTYEDSYSYIQVDINKNQLKNLLKDEFLMNYGARMFIIDQEGHVVVNNIENSDDYVDFEDLVLKEGDGWQLINIDGGVYLENWKLAVDIHQEFQIHDSWTELAGFTGIFIFILLIASIMVQYIARTISSRLVKINVAMDQTKHNTLVKIDTSLGKDEIGMTASGYNQMVDNIQNLLSQVEEERNKTQEMLVEKSNAYEELESAIEELAYVNNELIESHEEIKIQDIKIHELIYMDPLTGLMNRFAINQVIDKYLESMDSDSKAAIIFLDIDNFKFINDTFGHDIGDKVIGETGNKLRVLEKEKKEIHIGRFGGDEFLILIEGITDNDSLEYYLQWMKELFEQPLLVEGNRFYLTVSIGITLAPDNGITKEDLIKKADQALYSAKEQGRNNYVLYDEKMHRVFEEKLILQGHIKEAIKNEEFLLYYQPYINIRTHEVSGFEALIRWNSETLGWVSPYKLIVNAEEMGIIIEIGYWIIAESCKFIRKVNENREKPVTISINISVVQLMSKEFVDRLMAIINIYDVKPQHICLEMTETVMLNSIEYSTMILQKLKAFGFGIALDDFGTGYSSLSYFKKLPISILKIDKMFIDDITSDKYNQDIVMTMLKIAHNKGITVTAEGVEKLEQMEFLDNLNCDTIQGYYYSKPLPDQDAINFLNQY